MKNIKTYEYECFEWTGSRFEPTGAKLIFRGRHEVECCHQLKRYLRDDLHMEQIGVGQYSGDVDAKLGERFYTWRLVK